MESNAQAIDDGVTLGGERDSDLGTGTFEQYRRLLFAIAYRMVGTAMEAEDIVQETFLRYRSAQPARIDNLKAYLTTITTRLCLDYLKAAQTQRQSYYGIWLPEPVAGEEGLTEEAALHANAQPVDPAPLPPEVISQQESISMAFLVILEQLTPIERAVLLLRGVFDYDYPEIATMIGKSEANCRQIFHRAQAQVHAQRPRFEVTPETHEVIVNRFMTAVQTGEVDGLLNLLTEDVTFAGDGGGKSLTVLNKLVSASKVLRFLLSFSKIADQFTAETRQINGRLGILLYDLAGRLDTVFTFQMVKDKHDPAGGARISNIYAMRNPDKLARIEKALRA